MDISRRGFLGGLLATVIAEAIPNNRVWFFPKDIKIVQPIAATIGEYADFITIADLTTIYYEKSAIDNLKRNTPLLSFLKAKATPAHTGDPIQLYRYNLGE